MRNGFSTRKNRLGNFLKTKLTTPSKRSAILAAATAWVAPLKRSPILAAVQAALSTPSRRSAVMAAAAATAMVVASAGNITPVRGDVTENFVGGNGGYWGTASYWSGNVVPNNTATTYIVDTSTGANSGYRVDLHGESFTIGGIFGNGSYISAIINSAGAGQLIIDPSTMASPIGSVINCTIESGTAGNPLVLQIGADNGSDSSIVTELNPNSGTIGGGTAATDDVKVVLDGIEGTANFWQSNSYDGGTVIENGATAIIENHGSLGTGQITFQTNGGIIKLGQDITSNVTNNMQLSAGATIDSAGFNATFSGAISNPIGQHFGLTIANSGGSGSYITLSGLNTYKGGTTIDDGAGLSVTGQIVGAMTLSGVSEGSTLNVLNNLSLTDLNGGSGAYITLGEGSTGSYTLSLRPTTNDTFAGQITDGFLAHEGGTVNFNGNSGTTFTLTGSISDVGFININSGTVVVGSGGNLNANDGSAGEKTTIGSNGTLTVNVGGSVAGYLVDNGTFNVNTNDKLSGLSDSGANGQVIISSGYALTLDLGQNNTFGGSISGAGGLTVAGGGHEFTLSGINSYDGATIIGGTGAKDELNVAAGGSVNNTSGFTINGNSELIVSGQIGGSVTMNGSESGSSYSTFQVNNNLNITDLNGSAGSYVNFGGGFKLTLHPTTNDTFAGQINGNDDQGSTLNFNGGAGTTFTLDGSGGYGGAHDLEYININSGTVVLSNGGYLDSDAGYASDAITIGSSGTLTVMTGGSIEDTSNLVDKGTFNVQSNVTIGDLNGPTSGQIIISTGVTLTVTTGTGVSDTFAGVISGPGGNLEVSGTGVLTLSGTNTYGDATTIDSGATLITTGTILGAMTDNGTWNIQNSLPGITDLSGSGAINILAGNTLTVAPTVGDTFSGNITGANASLTVNGASGTSLTLSGTYGLGGTTSIGPTGTLILTGNDTIGALQFSTGAGTFQAQGNESITDLNGTNGSAQVIISSGKTLTVAPTGSDTFAGEISGAGALTLGGVAGTKLTLSGINSYTGGTTINANATLTVTGVIVDAVTDNGTWNIQNGLGITDLNGTSAAAVINISSGDTLTVNATGSDTFAGKITGNGGALDLVSNSLTLSGALTYTGLTTVGNGATLTLSGTGDIIGAVLVNTGGTFAIAPNVSITDLNGGGTVTIATGDTLTSTPTTNDTFTGTITGLGAFKLAGGAGTSLTLGGANTYSGGTTINSGATLIISNAGSIVGPVNDNGTWTINNSLPGITDLNGSGSIGIGSGDTLTVAPTAADNFSGSISGAGGLTVNGATSLTLSGPLSYTGTTTIGTTATLIISSSNTLGAVQFGSSGAGALQVQNNLNITDLNGSGMGSSITIASNKLLTVAPTMADDYEGSISGAGGLFVNGGTLGDSLTLSGALTYAGTTTIGNTTTLILTNGSDSIGGVQFGTGAGSLQVQNNLSITDLNGSSTSASILVSSGKVLTVSPTMTDDFEGSLTGAGGFTLTEGVLTLSGNYALTGPLTVDPGATLNIFGTGGQTVYNLSGGGNITIPTGDVLTDWQNANTTFSGNISGGGGFDLHATAPATLTLSGTLTYTGKTIVYSGATMIITGQGDMIGALEVESGGTFEITPDTSIGDLTGGGSIIIGPGETLTSTGTMNDTFTGTVTDNGTFAYQGAFTQNMTGDITGAGVVRVGMGSDTPTLVLGGTDSYSGGTIINSGATLSVTGTIIDVVNDNGTFIVGSNLTGITDLFGSGALTIGENLHGNGFILEVTPTVADKLLGPVTDDGSLEVDGANSLELRGNVTGTGSIVAGTGSDSPTVILDGTDTYSGGTTINTGATLIVTKTGSMVGAATVNGTWDIENNLPGVTDLNGGTAGSIIITSGNALTVAPTNILIADTFSGVISDTGGTEGALIVNGPGSLELDGINTYTGGTTIGTSGSLIIGTSGSIVGALTDNGTFTMNNSLSLTDLNGTSTGASILIGSGNTLTVSPGNGRSDSFAGVISNNGTTGGALVVGGNTGSSLTLLGINLYTGGTTINAGATLNIGSSGSIMGAVTDNGTFGVGDSFTITDLSGTTVAAKVILGAGDTLTVTPTTNDTYAGIISGSGALTVGFSGTSANSLTLSGKNIYTGGTTINAGGTLNVTGSIGGAVQNEGTLDVNNSFAITDLTGISTSAVIILGTGDTLTINATHGTTADIYMGAVSGAGNLTLATGTMDFALTNGLTYTGTTTIDGGATMDVNGQIVGPVINNGTLVDQTNHTIGNLSGTGSIVLSDLGGAPQFLTVIETGATTFTGPISGPGGFTLDSNGTVPGTLTLTGPLSYTGPTTVGSMATMILSGTNASSIGALDVQAGGTFALLPNVSITDLSGGGTVSIGAGDTLTSTPTINDTFNGTIIGAGAFTLLGTTGTSLTLAGVNTYTGGTAIGSTATLIIGTGGSIVGSLTDNGTFTMENSLSLTDLNGTNSNAFINIDDNGTNPSSLTISPSGISNDSFAGVIQGLGSLTIGGNPGSSLTLLNNNLYTGLTTINAGATLNIAPSGSIVGAVKNNGTFGVENSFTITDLSGTGTGAKVILGSGDTLSVAPTMNDTYAGTVVGSGALTIGTSIPVGTSGTSLTLSGKNTYTGGTKINNGATFIVTGSIGGAVDNEGTFDVDNSFAITDLTGSSTSAAIILGAGDILTINATHGTTADIYMGSISGSGGLTLATGTMDFTLTNGLTYTGTTTIDGGATMDVNGQIVGPVINNGTLVDVTSQTIGNLSGTGAITLSSLNGTPQYLTVIETGATTFGGTITGSGGFTLDSNGTVPGTLTLTGPLSYTGLTTVGSMATMILSGTNPSSIGALDVQAGGTFALLPNVSITDLTGGGTVSIGVGDTLTSTPTMSDTFSGTIIGSGAFVLLGTTGTSLTLTGASTYTGGTTIGTTATLIVSGSITGPVTDDGTFTVENSFAITDLNGTGTSAQVILVGTNSLTITPSRATGDTYNGAVVGGGTSSGLIINGISGGIGNSLTLGGDLSSYTGTTTIENNGTLKIDYSDNLGSTAAVTFLGTGGGTLDFLGSGAQTLGNITLGGTDTIDAGQAAAGTSASNIVTFNGQINSASASNKVVLQDGTFVVGTNANLSGFDHGTVDLGNGTLPATLQFSTVAAVPPGTATATIEFNDGTVQYLGGSTIILPAAVSYVVDAAGGEIDNIGTAAGSIQLNGTITDTTGTLTFSGGNFILNANNSATLTGGTIAIGDAATTMQIDNQDAFGNAVVTVNDGSTLQTSNFSANSPTPGSSAGVLVGFNITAGAYMESTANTSASVLKLEMFGQSTNAAGYDKFQLGAGKATLNGTLDLGFLGGSVANPNINKPLDFDTYNIINTTGTVTDNGTFNNSVQVNTIDGKITISGGQTAAYTSGWSSIVDPNATADNYNLRFWEFNKPNVGQQVIIQTLFSGYAQTQNELSVAEYLDNNATPANTTPAQQASLQALSALGTNPGNSIGGVLNQFLPTDYAQLTQIGIQNATFLNQQVFGQIANGFGGGTVNTNGLSIMQTNGESPDPFSMALNTQLQNTDESVQQTASFMDNYNSWSVGEPVPSNTNQNPANSQAAPSENNSTPLIINSWSGFITGDVVISNTPSANTSGGNQPDYMTGGILAGAGIQLDDNWSVGGFFNWGYTGASLDGVGSHQQGNSYTPGLFVGFQDDGWYADGLASYTYSSYRIDRNVQFSGSNSTATGQPTSSQYDVAMLGGYNAQVTDAFQIGPSAGVGYTHVDVSSFSETGSPFDMNVGSHSADSFRTLLGLAGQYTFAGKNAPLPIDINFNAYWQHEFLNNSTGISSSMGSVGGPGSFIFNTNGPSRDSVLGGLGVSGHINPNIALFANYELQAGANNLFGNTVFAGVAFSFK